MTPLCPTDLGDHLIDQTRWEHPRENSYRHQIRQPTIRLRLPPPSSWHTTKLHQCDSNLTVLALALTEAVTRLSDQVDPVPDEIWAEATRHYDETQLGTLVLAIAKINVWNRLNAATRQIAGK